MTTHNQNKIEQDIIQQSVTLTDQANCETKVLKDKQAFGLADKYNKSIHDIYSIAFTKKIIPYRYIRNLQSFTIEDQIRLWESCVSIVGAGGLGGHVILLLARLGIGNLIIVDHDVFDETNLNRQVLSNNDVLGKSKALVAKETVKSINPGVYVSAHQTKISKQNAGTILKTSNVIVDALDNISDRFIIEDAAKKIKIPLVHGAVAGFEGQIMTVFPNDAGMEDLYGKRDKSEPSEKKPVTILGIPAVTPAIIASYQAIEVVKIILKKENLFRNTMVYMDLERCESKKLYFKKN